MGYINKNIDGLVITRLTDIGRRKISQGNFKISYFQLGDSEVDYNFNSPSNLMILSPEPNSQNNVGIPSSTKNGIKYPFYLSNTSGTTYGNPFEISAVESVFNTASPIGFFTPDKTCASTTPQMILNQSSEYMVNAKYRSTAPINSSSLLFSVTNTAQCSNAANTNPRPLDFVTIYYNNQSVNSNIHCSCMSSCRPILTYRTQTNNSIDNLDRDLLDLTSFIDATGRARAFVFSKTFDFYNFTYPINAKAGSVYNYGSLCPPEDLYAKIWNMNIVWTENIAGLQPNNYDFKTYKSINYLGSKEYYGYMGTNSKDTSMTYYYNSVGEKIVVTPSEQKVISIVHYSNNTILNIFGEKFSAEPYDPTNPNATGQARNFKVSLPWLMWHKNSNCCGGAHFYVDPPGFDSLNLLQSYHIQSTKNSDMNNPGIRYFHLYDTNPNLNDNGRPNRVGKVFPDDKIIIFDDEEIVAAMSYASNRNFTLPAPKVNPLYDPSDNNNFFDYNSNSSECYYITYLFSTNGIWDGLHCNYYQKICKSELNECDLRANQISVSFGDEFNCMEQPTTNFVSGWFAKKFYILVSTKCLNSERPIDEASTWKIMDFTTQLQTNGYINSDGFIDPQGLVNETFIIKKSSYDNAPDYNINNFIFLPQTNEESDSYVQLGDEYYFYGTVQTDIESTIYEMKYAINLSDTQFVKSSNPTFTEGKTPYMSEIGLYDEDKNLLVYSKLQSPQERKGTQQILIKLDL